MNTRLLLPSIALGLVAAMQPPASADIVQESGGSSISFVARSRFGQSFTASLAETIVTSVSFRWASFNASQPDPTITVQLRDGAGYDGPVLATRTVAEIPNSTAHGAWIDFAFDFPPLLLPGETYTLQFTQDAGGLVSGGYQSAGLDAYDGGTFFGSGGGANPDVDLAFRVVSSLAVSVPEGPAWLCEGLVTTACGVALLGRRQLACRRASV